MFDCVGDLYAVVRVISSGKTNKFALLPISKRENRGLIAAPSSSDVVLFIQSTRRVFVFVKGSYLKSISTTEEIWKILGNRRTRRLSKLNLAFQPQF